MAVDRADAADEPVGRRARDELLQRAAPALRGDDERGVLDERCRRRRGRRRSRVPCAARGAPARDRLGPAVVEPDVVALEHLGEVGAHAVEIEPSRSTSAGRRRSTSRRLDHDQRVAGHHGVADGDGDRPHDARRVGGDDVLHLHRLEHDELLADAHVVALVDVDRHDGALHRRRDRRVGRCHRRAVPLSR